MKRILFIDFLIQKDFLNTRSRQSSSLLTNQNTHLITHEPMKFRVTKVKSKFKSSANKWASCKWKRLSITQVGSTSAHGILSWTIASNRTYSVLRYHGRWILTKNGKKIFAVQIEKTEVNILQKTGEKSFCPFQDRREKLFLNLINPWRCIDKFLSSPIKIHRQLSRVM